MDSEWLDQLALHEFCFVTYVSGTFAGFEGDEWLV